MATSASTVRETNDASFGVHGQYRPANARSRLLLLVVVSIASGQWLFAQATQPDEIQPASRPTSQLPTDVREALERIEDFSLSFSQPGFYSVLEHVKAVGVPLAGDQNPRFVTDWNVLLERPADFRGLLVTVEGVVGRNTQWYFEQPRHRRLGPVSQLELSSRGQPIAVTLIFTEDANDIPLGATIRATGYFVMVRQYYSRTNRLRQAALLVGDGPALVSHAAAQNPARRASPRLIGTMVACSAGALIVWLILRRSVRPALPDPGDLRATGPATENLADDLAQWAASDPDLASKTCESDREKTTP